MKFQISPHQNNELINAEAKQFLLENGYVTAKSLLSQELLVEIDLLAQGLISQQTQQEAEAHKSLGSLMRLWSEPRFTKLICSTEIKSALRILGADDLRFSNGYLFSKPAHSPRTFWHQDWWLWEESASFSQASPQIGALIYLDTTIASNGCLRVIPGSHMKRHKLHNLIYKYEIKELRRYQDPSASPFMTYPEEQDVPIEVGDVVFFDARLLHAAHANDSNKRRSAITLWYFPNYLDLSEPAKARIGSTQVPADWPQSFSDIISDLLPKYSGQAQPAEIFTEGMPK